MTYRDDNARLEAKNAELEQKLSEAEARIAKLSGEGPAPPAPSPDESVVLAGPSRMHASHDLDYEITTEGYEAIARVVQERLHLPVTQIGSTLASPGTAFRLTQREGRAHFELSGDWSSLVGGWVASSGLLGIFGGFIATGVFHDLAHLTDGQAGMVLLATIPLVGSLAALFGRGRIQQQAQEKLRSHQGTIATVLELAEKHRVKPRVRVELSEPAGAEDDALGEEPATVKQGDRSSR